MESGLKSIYVIGSLRNPKIPIFANSLRALGYEVFDDWYAAGERADDHWQDYEKGRGRTYKQALEGRFSDNGFAFDKRNLERVDCVILLMPAGKSGHLELGYAAGLGKQTYILFPDGEPERWDLMYKFANAVFFSEEELTNALVQRG